MHIHFQSRRSLVASLVLPSRPRSKFREKERGDPVFLCLPSHRRGRGGGKERTYGRSLILYPRALLRRISLILLTTLMTSNMFSSKQPEKFPDFNLM